MLGRTYEREVCSAARALEIAGERWSLLILRNAAFASMTHFTDFQKSLGLAPNVLAARLDRFVKEGLMVVSPGSKGQHEYHLTEKGLDFKQVIIALTEWGDRWAAPHGPPIVYEHERCGSLVEYRLHCPTCAEDPGSRDVRAHKTTVMAKLQDRRRARSSRAGSRPRERRRG